jgi:hypothetical protein
MTSVTCRTLFGAAILAAAVALSTPRLAAGQGVEAPGRTRPPSGAQAPAPAPTAPLLSQNASQTRRDFYEVLEQYPPAVGRVLRLDPTLMTNPSYLASYPNIAAFLAQYPDVARNPGFYLERYEPNYAYNVPTDARGESLRMWRDALDFLGAFSVFCVIMFALFGLIKYIVEYRRWHRVYKVNSDIHNRILERFGSNEELLAYVDSPAGRRFLEATPLSPGAPPARNVSAPYGRILLSVQVGVILLALAIGFLVIGDRAIEEVQPVVVSLSVLGFCLGIGSIVSAAASFILSRKLGLLPDAPAARPEHIA